MPAEYLFQLFNPILLEMKTLNDKIAVITGGNSGIGFATAKELHKNNARVIITGRRKETIQKAASELKVTGMIADQSRIADINQLASTVSEQFGEVDILLINAGITKSAPIESTSE